MFVSEDKQLRATHLILDYEPISRFFQDVGQALRASNPRLARVNVSKLGFIAWRDLPPVVLPARPIHQEVAAPREETASTHLSLEAEIDQFHLDEEGEAPNRLVEVSDSKARLDRSSTTDLLRLIVTRFDYSEEEEDMALNQRRSLRDLLANRNKRSSSKKATKSQVPSNLPPPPLLPPTDLGINIMKDLKKKRMVQDLEKGEVALQKGMKQ